MNWKIAQSIYNKIISKCPIGTLNANQKKNPINYSLRMSIARSATMSEHEIGGTTGFRLVSQNYETAKKTHLAG